MNLQIFRSNRPLDIKIWDFPSGEIGFRIESVVGNKLFPVVNYQTIFARLNSSKDIMLLIMAVNALRQIDNTPIRLFLPKVPYAQQDRVCVDGESHSLRAFADIINNLNFERVTIIDPHSDVAGAVINNVKIISQLDVINKFEKFHVVMRGNPVIVSPDAGANKKTSSIAAYFGHNSFVRADKLRDLSNGQIKETIVYSDKLENKTAVIIDDICLAGGTFIALAKELKRKGAAKVILYVTHGVFNKGVEILHEGGIDSIYTTNSFKDDLIIYPNVYTFDIFRFVES